MQKNKKSNDLFLSYLGESLRQRRIELLLSQEELAVLAKLHRTYVTEVEKRIAQYFYDYFIEDHKGS